MAVYEFFLASSLEKVFPSVRPRPMEETAALSVWRGARAAVQLVYYADADVRCSRQRFSVEVAGGPGGCRMRRVELAPSNLPCYGGADDGYLTKQPGLFPDPLAPAGEECVRPLPGQYRSLWVSFDVPEDALPGDYRVRLILRAKTGERLPNGETPDSPAAGQTYETGFTLRVKGAVLAPQALIHTEWFHCDCLSTYYGVQIWSEAHWEIVGRFMRAAVREHGINMLLTPVFTPPLDTAVGGERPSVQLVDVFIEGGKYRFAFDKLERWVSLCRENGVAYLEIAHLFTQWGAHAAPNIYGTKDGAFGRLFGWDTPADSPEYHSFLEAFLPAVRNKLENLGYGKEHVYFHISDEPALEQMEDYRLARKQVEKLLEGCPIADALSSFAFYQAGLVKRPIPASDHIGAFLDAGVKNLWVYYCCAQGNRVPNRFFSMPSARNRIMGVLLYLYDIRGLLHWGYNFYNSEFSLEPVDPWRVTDAQCAFPSGDPFLVYPGPDGEPVSSIRAEVQDEALLDLRALCQLDKLAGRKFTESLIYENTEICPITFVDYPKDADYLLRLRERVAEELEKRCS